MWKSHGFKTGVGVDPLFLLVVVFIKVVNLYYSKTRHVVELLYSH